MKKYMEKLAGFIVDQRKWVLCIFVALTVVSVILSHYVKMNYDMTTYLPEDSSAKQGVAVMKDEFKETTALSIMLQDLSEEQKQQVLDQLKAIDGVDSVTYEADSEDYNKDGYSLFTVNIADKSYSARAAKVLEDVKNNFDGQQVYIAGEVVDSQDDSMDRIMIIAVILLVIILFIMSESFLEPVLMMVAIGMAVLIAMGTNVIFPSVSNMTHSIAAILQLALSMDYSIMLMDRYHQEKAKQVGKVQAMKNAISKGFASIASSSVTTIVGLLCLVFMSFTIGRDMGLVLAKSVLISLICILFVLSSLLVIFDKYVEKSNKKVPAFRMIALSKFSYRFRYFILPAFLIVFVGSYTLKDQLGITYAFKSANKDQIKIESVFPTYNSVVLLYNNEDEDKTNQLVDNLKSQYGDDIENISSYGQTLGKEMHYSDLASTFGMDESVMKMLYYNYFNEDGTGAIKIADFINFLCDDVAQNETFSSEIDADMLSQLDMMKSFANSDAIRELRSPAQIADLLGMNESDISSLYMLYYVKNGGVEKGTMTLSDFVTFVQTEVVSNPTYATMLDASVQEQLSTLSAFTDENTLTTAMTSDAMAQLTGMDQSMVSQLYFSYYMSHGMIQPESMTIGDFVTFLQSDVMTNPSYASMFDDSAKNQLSQLAIFTDKDTITVQRSAQELAGMLGMDSTFVQQLFGMHSQMTGSQTNSMSLTEFADFVVGTVATIPDYAPYFDEATMTQLGTARQLMQLTLSDQALDATQMAQIVGMDTATIDNLYVYHMMLYGDRSGYVLTPQQFVNYLINDIATDATYSDMIDAASLAQLSQLQTIINSTLNHTTYSPSELAAFTGMDEQTMNMLYLYRKNVMGDTADWKMSLYDFVAFLIDDVSKDAQYGSMLDDSTLSQLQTMQTIMDGVLTQKSYTASQMMSLVSDLSDQISDDTMKLLYLLYFSEQDSSNQTISMYDFAHYMVNDVVKDELFASFFDEDTVNGLNSSIDTMDNGKSQLVGPHYARLIINTKYGEDSPEVYTFLEDLKQQCRDQFDSDFYIVGSSMINYETRQSFEGELNFINLLTIVAIFLVIVVTFKSLSIPVILVAMIQGAIYLVMGINFMQGIGIYYLALVIVQSILMGAAIDYSILYTTYYTTLRREYDVPTTIQKAYQGSMSTILTSSSILIGITFIVGMISTNQSTSEICLTLSKGALIALLQVVFLLPGVLAALDRFVVGKRGK